MTNAPHAGKHWTDIAGRDRGLARTLLMALPLLLLLLAGQGATAPAERPDGAAGSQASDVLGAESKAQLVGRAWLLGADQHRSKPKLSGDGLGTDALAISAAQVRTGSASSAMARLTSGGPASPHALAARPRAPPAAA